MNKAAQPSKKSKVSALNIEPEAYHLFKACITKLTPENSLGGAKKLPNTLVIPPGIYCVHGRTYCLDQEGLYRFLWPKNENQQRIVYKKDVTAFVSAMCWIHSHGSRDDKDRGVFETLTEKAKTDKLIMTCGPYSNLTCKLFAQNGICARQVGAKVMKPKQAGNDGHVLLEVLIEGQWMLFDIDAHTAFVRRGKRLNLLDTILAIRQNDYELECLAESSRLAVGSFRQKGYDFGMWMETSISSSNKALQQWYHHVMLFPVISDAAGNATTCAETDRYELKTSWPQLPWLSEIDFRKRFYEGNNSNGLEI